MNNTKLDMDKIASLSPFELKDVLISIASGKHTILSAVFTSPPIA